MFNETICPTCGNLVELDGEFPKQFYYCIECGDYVDGPVDIDLKKELKEKKGESHEH